MSNTQDHPNGHDDHGAAHGQVEGDIIPENSWQDMLLKLLAMACLLSLVGYGFIWALALIAAVD